MTNSKIKAGGKSQASPKLVKKDSNLASSLKKLLAKGFAAATSRKPDLKAKPTVKQLSKAGAAQAKKGAASRETVATVGGGKAVAGKGKGKPDASVAATLNGAAKGGKAPATAKGAAKGAPASAKTAAATKTSKSITKSLRTPTNLVDEQVCREVACEGLATSAGYCRMHYIKNWKKIQRKEGILREGKLNQYIEELVAKYPDKYIEAIRMDLADDKQFAKVIYDLELDEGVDEFEGDAEAVEGIIDIKRDFDDEGDAF